MVSFQCHNCGDVVKKPKLDQHRTRCHGGFDCIDCSTTFNSPAEYKGHTSCISEAEKYQKGLYKGPRMGESAPKNNYPPQSASEPYPGGGSSWTREAFRGGRGGRGGFSGRGGWGQRASRGTGANDTPLGTPSRMSPVTQSAPAPVKEVPVVESSNDSCNGKKRKSMGSEDTVPSNGDASSHKRAKISEQTDVRHVEPASVPLSAAQCEVELKKEKRSKKEKKSPDEVGEKEGKKRKKKEAAPADIVENGSEQAERLGKKEKSNRRESDEEEKKRRKEKRKDREAADEDAQQNSLDLDSKKERKKNKKKGKEDTESAVSKDGLEETSSKKEKKRKERRKDEILAGEDSKQVDEDVDAKKKKKKEKKALEDTINTDSISTSGEVKEKKSKKLKVAELGI